VDKLNRSPFSGLHEARMSVIHGLPRWSRVWFHGRALAARLDVNPVVLAWFAFPHDRQHHNDHRDPQHGQRAARQKFNIEKEHSMNRPTDIQVVARAADFAARRHTHQHRKGEAAEPYVNHLAHVAALLADGR